MRAKKRRGGDNGSYWISYSDLMAGMLFTFALILFVAIYQLVDLQAKKTLELETKEAELITQQSLVLDQEAKLAENTQLLALRQTELEEKNAELTQAQAGLALQQAKIDEQERLLAAQQLQIDNLVGMRSRIIEELRDELRSENLDAVVDRNTGAIAFTGAVLFDLNRNELKDSGKALLGEFIPIYIRTLMSAENAGFIGEIIIEGHTDTSGSYMHNLALSQERALAVAAYCFGAELTGLNEPEKEMLKQILTVNGRSYADPVYRADGTVDMEASRRVVFKFRMKDAEMIDQMSAILEGKQADAQTVDRAEQSMEIQEE